MNQVYRLVWNGGLLAMLLAADAANATPFIDFSNGLSDWTTGGDVTLSSTTVTVPTGGPTFTLTPAAGYEMARINAPDGGGLYSPNATLGLTANSLESFLNGGGSITNFGLLTKSFAFNVGTYTFAWAYGAEDYQPYNDGAVFSLSGGGSQSLVSLARNGRDGSDISGPSPNTLILGSYGATPWLTLSFDIATAGTYQVGFAVYNWNDDYLAPNLYVSGIEGTYSGTPVDVSGGTLPPPAPPVIGTSGGNVSGSVFDTSSTAYSATELTFDGGTLQYTADASTSKDAVLSSGGGAIDSNGFTVDYTGAISGSGDFSKEGAGTLVLTNNNTYTGETNINAGTLKLTGTGTIAASTEVINNGTLDISGTTAGASVQTMSGTGTVALGSQDLTIINASSTFAGDITGSGALELAAGTLALTGANTYTGDTKIDGGTLKLVGIGSVAASDAVINNGVLDISGTTSGAAIQTISGSGAVALGNKALTITNGSGAYGGAIDGAGNVQLAGGEITLSGANSYTGMTTIGAGTLKLAGTGSLATSSGVVNNGVLDISGLSSDASIKTLSGGGIVELGSKAITLTDASGSFDGGFAGTGSVNVAAGTLTLGGTSTHTGGTSVTNGAKIIVASDAALGDVAGALSLNNGALANTTSLPIARDIVIGGAAAFDTAADTSITIAGKFSGGGDILKTGAGSLVLASDNGAFGQGGQPASLIVNDGTVVVTHGQGLGNASVILSSGSLSAETNLTLQSLLAVAPNTSISAAADTVFVVNAPITSVGSGNGCFEKTGPGTLVMAGRADIDAGTCVQDGKLYANGLLNSVVTVQSDGTLRGIGAISGATTVYGRLAPGNSPGVLQITGSVTMAPGSTYQEDINGLGTTQGPGSYSRLIVTGADSQFVATGATLEPNLVNVTGSDSYIPYVPKVGDAFRIVTAEGGIVGEFASVTQPQGLAPNTRLETYYNTANSNSIDLFVVPTSYGAYVQGRSGNGNALSTATALDTLVTAKSAGIATPAQDEVLHAVSAQTDTTLEATTTALAGELHGALVAAAPLASRWLMDSVGRQLSYAAAEGSHDVWVDVGANRSDWKSDATASGFDTSRSQIALGWDLLSSDAGRLGIGFTHGKVDVAATSGSGSVTENLAFAYGQLQVNRVVVESTAAFGDSDWETDRRDPLAPLTMLRTDFGGHDTAISLGMRVPLQATRLSISPYARAVWQRVSRDGFSEDSASLSSLASADYTHSGTRVTAGVLGGSRDQRPLAARFTYQFNVGMGRDGSGLAQPSFGATFAGIDTTIRTPQVGRTFGLGQLSATARLTSWMYVHFGVSGEARSGKSEDVGASLGARVVF